MTESHPLEQVWIRRSTKDLVCIDQMLDSSPRQRRIPISSRCSPISSVMTLIYDKGDSLSKMYTAIEPCSSGVEELTIGLVSDRERIRRGILSPLDQLPLNQRLRTRI
jgi:hypothetical protein